MNHLFEAGLELQVFFQKRVWPFCFIGGLAVLRWGDPRMTQDLDVCLLCGLGNEEKFIDELIGHFTSRIADAKDFGLQNRILLVKTSRGIPIDISLSGLPFEEKMIRRATAFSFTPECSLLTAPAEDIIVLKSFADRPRDWADVESIIMRQGKKLDKEYVFNELNPLCELKKAPGIIDRLKRLF